MSQEILHCPQPFLLESGKIVPQLQITYHTYGKLNAKKNNVIWVCHALTANADVFDWWKGLFGQGFLFNPEEHFIVCANILGSCYGTTGPLSKNPATGTLYYQSFPDITIRDMVAAHEILRQHLGISKINILLGGSLGGQQALEWAILQPEIIQHLLIVATNAFHSPWGIAFNEAQRMAIRADETFHLNIPEGGRKGLKAARAIALLSYRTYDTYCKTQRETDLSKTDNFNASSYQNYQGDKLVNRFDAYSYTSLSRTMDSHNVGRQRHSVESALQQIKAKTLVIGISSDLLFPVTEQQFLAQHIPGALYQEIDSFYGHDGFLIETEKLTQLIETFLAVPVANR
ncbi:homoserine O-acetyltransferase [Adhaeribacter arboris]|uniref:Homoserine O-acetyltransferase n=1 Tax=Adhaeribacter arboris TaxID=2072846 RepID=A0A2T2YM25_9BACT|nr:homoserine O-acetyltransferase [Adhaeribacter arboris]PSR56560.1 homoserine O-acetyltransferase [Adhaeribacter arboris]